MDARTQIIRLLYEHGRPEILKRFRRDSCIASVRVAVDVLAHFHILAEPLVVNTMIFNPPYTARLDQGSSFPTSEELKRWTEEDGSWSVGLGMGVVAPGGWKGHLVAWVPEDDIVIDLSIDQAHRPQHNIIVEHPVVQRAAKGFLDGVPLIFRQNECLFVYTAVPEDKSFAVSPNWHSPRPGELEVTKNVIGKIENARTTRRTTV